MRKLALGFALASTVLATPALAKDKAWYLEVDAGAIIVKDAAITAVSGSKAGTVTNKTGSDFGTAIGYDFGHFRLETEVSYRRARFKTLDVGAASYSQDAGTLGGSSKALAVLENVLIDFGPDDGLQGFVGAGFGVARVRYNLANSPYGIADSNSRAAYQFIAGVRAPLTKDIDVGLKYVYFSTEKFKLDTGSAWGSNQVSTRYQSHSLLGTLTYNFGGAPAPAPEPAPEPAPPPPPVCEKGPYIVFFDWDKSDITPEASTILDNAITAYGNCASVPIQLAGYADRSGKPKYNVALSQRRNTSVTTYLTAHGVPAAAISSQAFGEANPRVPTADGVRELQNRRVEITYGPGSGM
ncbi:OmpA family protein [Novosphingobium sp.]|uniref:OmpA family protein n=1 Tax=Novosphingobium sp. TaxID=1874826 RepID=UPI0038BD2AF6